jgi:speckle-type POZ protein
MKFIKRDDLERSGRLKDDRFTVRCNIIIIGKIQAVDTAVVPSSASAAIVVVHGPLTEHLQEFSKSLPNLWFLAR